MTALVPIARLGRCRGGGEGVEAGKHGMLVFPIVFNELIVRGWPSAERCFPKGFQGFGDFDLDTFKTDQ